MIWILQKVASTNERECVDSITLHVVQDDQYVNGRNLDLSNDETWSVTDSSYKVQSTQI